MKIENQIYTVKTYNQLAETKWREDCRNWNGGKGGFPHLSMYIYEQDYGYVLRYDGGSKWFKTKAEAIKEQEKRNQINL